MRKFLHMAGGIAKKTLATAAKLAKKLAHIVLQAAGAAVSAVGKAVKDLLGKAACGVGKKVQKFIPPVCKVVMIVSGAVALLSCVGWLISRKAKRVYHREMRRGASPLNKAPRFPRTAQRKVGESKGDLSKYEEKGIQGGEQAPAGPDDQFHLHPQGDIPAGDHL